MPLRDTAIKEKPTVKILMPKKEKVQSETDKKRLARFNRKLREGRIGNFISWIVFSGNKKELQESDFAEYKKPYGRLSNKIYLLNENGKFILFKKFKNSTKAKRFFMKEL